MNSQLDANLLAFYQTGADQQLPHQPAHLRDRIAARMTPLEDRLRHKLAQLPAEVVEQGLHMNQIWPLCSGVQRSKPRAFEVADALRSLGWQRVRVYSDQTSPSGTYWFPPDVKLADAKSHIKGRK